MSLVVRVAYTDSRILEKWLDSVAKDIRKWIGDQGIALGRCNRVAMGGRHPEIPSIFFLASRITENAIINNFRYALSQFRPILQLTD